MEETSPPALKEIFDAARFRQMAKDVSSVYPRFDSRKFLGLTLPSLPEQSLLQRMRSMSHALHATLPLPYPDVVQVLRDTAPLVDRGFVTLVFPDYVSVYGREHFALSMEALKYFTPFGSSEFAVREFIRIDFARALKTMEKWSKDKDEHVRRLASEGTRPRLPWSFRLDRLILDPAPVAPLREDPSLYVRKSVANHLNDITKDHPEWVLTRLQQWDLDHPHTSWIAKRALRTMIKRGDARALSVIGVEGPAEVAVKTFQIHPTSVRLGEQVRLALSCQSLAQKPQKLVIDYIVHYVKKAGHANAKVFKWKELILGPGESMTLEKRQRFQDFTTRVHHPGLHKVELMINGQVLAEGEFHLTRGGL
jgi:3-methyladenine DNA glycosylase AlkC